MTSGTRILRTVMLSRVQSEARERQDRPKLVAALLAGGTFLLIGGGIFIAANPNAPTAPGRNLAAGKAESAAAPGTQAPANGSGGITHFPVTAVQRADVVGSRSLTPAQFMHPFHIGHTRPSRSKSPAVITYIVKPGDTLSGIATWFKLHGYSKLYAANRAVIGSNPALIFPGERITITGGGVMTLNSAHTDRRARG